MFGLPRPGVCLCRRSNQYAQQLVCDTSLGGCGAILSYFPTAMALALRKSKAKSKSKARGGTLEQRAQALQTGDCEREDVCPRCQKGFHVFQSQTGQKIMQCHGWLTTGRDCTFIKAMPGEVIVPGGASHSTPSQSSPTAAAGGLASGSGKPSKDTAAPPDLPNQSLLIQQQLAELQRVQQQM